LTESALGASLRDHRGLRLALHAFKEINNRSWIVERHGQRTPAQIRADQLGARAMAA
jgi:hypothetical protein